MDSFFALKDKDNTFHVECLVFVHRELLKCHPDFLKPYEGSKGGYNTKFFLLIADNLDEATAIKQAAELNNKYAEQIRTCEETGNWDDFAFKDSLVIYYK